MGKFVNRVQKLTDNFYVLIITDLLIKRINLKTFFQINNNQHDFKKFKFITRVYSRIHFHSYVIYLPLAISWPLNFRIKFCAGKATPRALAWRRAAWAARESYSGRQWVSGCGGARVRSGRAAPISFVGHFGEQEGISRKCKPHERNDWKTTTNHTLTGTRLVEPRPSQQSFCKCPDLLRPLVPSATHLTRPLTGRHHFIPFFFERDKY